jgi:hypothetical protein
VVDSFSKRLTGNEIIDRNFSELERFSREVVAGNLLDNVIIENITIGTSVTTIPHSLGREPIGWVIVRQDANATVWEPSQAIQPTTLINLQASNAVTVSILLF